MLKKSGQFATPEHFFFGALAGLEPHMVPQAAKPGCAGARVIYRDTGCEFRESKKRSGVVTSFPIEGFRVDALRNCISIKKLI